MANKKTSFDITLESSEMSALVTLAKKHNKDLAVLAKELIMDALETHEDMVLSELSRERMKDAKNKSEKTICHEDAWK